MSELRAVLWDMDGTLVDSERVWDVTLEALAQRLGGTLSPDARAAMVGTNGALTMDLLYADLGILDGDAVADATWLDEQTLHRFADGLQWRPGAAELLAAVRAAGLSTALVTATNRPLVTEALHTVGAKNFDVLVCGGETDRPKPAPDPYRRAMELLAVGSADCVVIEDSPTGIAAGLAAGCAVLGIPCAVPVAAAPGLTLRDTLVGLTVADLRALVSTAP